MVGEQVAWLLNKQNKIQKRNQLHDPAPVEKMLVVSLEIVKKFRNWLNYNIKI